MSILAAAAIVAWALTDIRFRNPEGALTASFILPWTFAGVFGMAGWAAGTVWFRAACWATPALLAYAASLLLIDAGPLIHYQHYRPERLTPLISVILGCQTVAVLFAIAGSRREIIQWLRRQPLLRRAAWLLGFTLLFSAAASERIGFYISELAFAAVLQAIQIVNLLLIARAIPGKEGSAGLRTILNRHFAEEPEPRAHRNGLDLFAVYGAVWVVLVSALLSFLVYERHPHIADEVAYIYHARYLAAGMLRMPLPHPPAAFDIDLMNYEHDVWFSPVPPGWPFMLSLGVVAGAPWLVNPLLAGLNTLLSYLLLRDLYSRSMARTGVLLLCISPWYIFMAMNFMTHTFTLTCALSGALAVVRWRRAGHSGWAAAAGLAAGTGSLIRPLDGLIIFAWLLVMAVGLEGKRIRITGAATLLIATGITASAALPYNRLLTGDPLKAPIMAYMDKYYGPGSNALGFGRNRGVGWALDPFPGHSPLDAAVNAALNGFSLHTELFGWSIGSLGFLSFVFASRNRNRSDWLLISLLVLVPATYSLYWYSGGPDFGARYWYLLLPACIGLTARGIEFVRRQQTPDSSFRVSLALALLCATTVAIYIPWRAVDKYRHYLLMRPGVQNAATACSTGRTLVLVQGLRFPDYASAAVYNPIHLDADQPVYAWDKDTQTRREVLQAFSDRSVCVVEGPTRTGRGYRLVDGPVSAASAMAAKTR